VHIPNPPHPKGPKALRNGCWPGCVCLSLSLSASLSLSLSLCVLVYRCLSLSVSVRLCLCLSVSVYACLYLFGSVWVCLFHLCLSGSLRVCLSVSVSPSVCLSAYLYICAIPLPHPTRPDSETVVQHQLGVSARCICGPKCKCDKDYYCTPTPPHSGACACCCEQSQYLRQDTRTLYHFITRHLKTIPQWIPSFECQTSWHRQQC